VIQYLFNNVFFTNSLWLRNSRSLYMTKSTCFFYINKSSNFLIGSLRDPVLIYRRYSCCLNIIKILLLACYIQTPMTLYPIETGNFKLDGGAMFGVVPKTLWSRTNPADANNMIDIAARSLLIEDGDRLFLKTIIPSRKMTRKYLRTENK